MARRITIEIKVEEQATSNQYSWATVASAQFVSSVEMFAPDMAIAGLVTGVEKLLGQADEKSDAWASADKAAPEIPSFEEVMADEAVPA